MDGVTERTTHDLTLERHFKAPPALMFKVWTQAEHLARWWGCGESTVGEVKTDPRVGGRFKVEMLMEDGSSNVLTGEYRAVDPNDYLEFTWNWEEGQAAAGEETLVTITFKPQGDGTDIVLNHQRFVDTDMRDAHGMGWGSGFDRLDVYLPEAV